jgi:hypothetical protein
MPLAALAALAQAALEGAAQGARLAAAERGVGGVERARARLALVRARERGARVVEREEKCARCGRRLGVAAGEGGVRLAPLALLAGGGKVHAACLGTV